MNELSSKQISQKKYVEKNREEINRKNRERAKVKWHANPEESRKKRNEKWAKNREHNCKQQREYYQKNKEKYRKLHRDYSRELRKTVIEGYGGKCACCGESHQEFMALDHVNGGGTQERIKKKVHVHTLYRKVVKENFPPEYRILCHNCNASLGHYGYCPHNLETKSNKFE